MISLRDDNPTTHPPVVTVVILAAIASVYFFVQPGGAGAEARFTYANAAIPCEVVRARPLTIDEVNHTFGGHDRSCTTTPTSPDPFPAKNVYLAVLVSMFLHANLLHLGGNALFLWVFGNNIEDRMGHVWYLVFYLAGGLAAAAAYMAAKPTSTVPMIGASGAIAAVMGAYLVLFPRTPVGPCSSSASSSSCATFRPWRYLCSGSHRSSSWRPARASSGWPTWAGSRSGARGAGRPRPAPAGAALVNVARRASARSTTPACRAWRSRGATHRRSVPRPPADR